jgi:lysophospholipase L1-like esterase
MGCAIAIPCLLAVLLSPGSLAGDEVGLIWADHDRPGNPIFTASFGNGRWTTESFPPSGHFDDNYSPGLAFDPAGVPWAAWAGRRRTESPAIFLSRYASGAWSPERKIGGGAGAWESMPALAFDSPGNGWLAFSREAGSSTEIFCAPILAGAAGTAVLVSPPDVTPDVHPAVACASDGTPIVVWEGWENDRAQVFLSRYRAGRWTKERSLLPGGDEDRIWPEIFLDDRDRPVVSWRVNGESVSYREETDGRAWETVRSQPARASPASLPAGVAAEAWMAGRGGNNRNASWRCFPPAQARPQRKPDGRQSSASFRYIGYGDSITYGHDEGSDTSGWYGSELADLLAAAYPGHSFYLYNEGYPTSTTYDLLYGGGERDCPGINSVIDSHGYASRVLIMGGTNDIVSIGDPDLTKWYLGQIIDRARAKGVEPILATIIPRVDEGRYMEASQTMSLSYIIPLSEEKDCRLANPFGEFMQYYDSDYFWNNLYGYPSAWDGIHPAWWEGDYHIALAFQKSFSTAIPTPTPPPPAQIFVTSPNGGERLARGASYPIAWTPTNFPGNIRLHLNRGGVLDHTITPDTPNDGYYDWPISGSQAVGSDYAVVVQSAAFPYLADISDANFSIVAPATPTPPPPAQIFVTSPNGGERLTRGASYPIAWTPAGFPGNIRLHLNQGGVLDHTIDSDTPNDGYYDWPISGTQAVGSDYAVVVQSAAFPYLADISDANFSIVAPPTPRPQIDYNGDGRPEVAIWRPANGGWAVRDFTRRNFGTAGDCPVPADYNGDGRSEIAIFRSAAGLWRVCPGSAVYFGISQDIPVPADYTGDGTEETAVFRSSSGLWAVRNVTRIHFGTSGDTPLSADFDRDGRADVGIFRPASGLWKIRGVTRANFGASGDYPVPADYLRRGRLQIAIARPGSGLWAIQDATRIWFGSGSFYPQPADWNGDGADDIASFWNGYTGAWAIRPLGNLPFGAAGDLPVAARVYSARALGEAAGLPLTGGR